MNPLSESRLYGILDTGYVEPERLVPVLQDLIRGGVDIVQLRAKNESAEQIAALARKLVPVCNAAKIPFILNDHPELVPETGADGAHVGQEDLSIAEARRLAGPGKLIGKSTHSPEQASAASLEHPDYIGFGPLFATPTKPDYTPIGTEDIHSVHARFDFPIFCIGGIKLSNLPKVIDSGAKRVVIVSDLLLAADPAEQTAACKKLLLPS